MTRRRRWPIRVFAMRSHGPDLVEVHPLRWVRAPTRHDSEVGRMIYVQRAQPGLVEEMLAILLERHTWAHEEESDRWPAPFPLEGLVKPVARGHAYLVHEEFERFVACFVLEPTGCPDYWSESERFEPALYLGRLAIRRTHRHLGAEVFNWTRHHAHRSGYELVRLNTWRDDTDFHKYYLDHGFQQVRTMEIADCALGALFEIDARPFPSWDRARDHEPEDIG